MVYDSKTNVRLTVMNHANLKKSYKFLFLELGGSAELTSSHCMSLLKALVSLATLPTVHIITWIYDLRLGFTTTYRYYSSILFIQGDCGI